MNFTKITRVPKRIIELGPLQTTKICTNKLQRRYFILRWKSKAVTKKANHSWDQITKKHKFTLSFNQFFLLLKNKPFIDQKPLIADLCQIKNEIEIANTLLFYTDIKIPSNKSETLAPDIKDIWNMGRCQELPLLGQHFANTNDKIYAQQFVEHVTNFMDQNPYMLGANWYNGMEVAIRAINWVHAFNNFKDAEEITPEFWQKFVCSLYDHFHYIENNFEWYDGKTNNHYLADLLGYYYLCWFFSDLRGVNKKQKWCLNNFLKELDKQIFPEGTSYEGSTAYHQLITEITQLFFALAQTQKIELSAHYQQKLQQMLEFLWWCTPYHGSLIKIGDSDSGKIIANSYIELSEPNNQSNALTFAQFGLSVLKNPTWHIALRQHAFMQQQPSGHFHNDILSITITLNGIPIFIDPGSFTYTPSIFWRNYFRSVEQHNTFYVAETEPIPLDDNLFKLSIPHAKLKTQKLVRPNQLFGQHNLYKNLTANRLLTLNQHNNLTILDWWEFKNQPQLASCWNFMLHPDITPIFENGTWQLLYSRKPIAQFDSQDLEFTAHKNWASLHYGSKIQTWCLRSQKQIDYGTNSIDLSLL